MAASLPKVWLKRGREKSLRRRHPWVFSGAIERVERELDPGATVDIVGADGEFLGRAAFSPASQIRARVWSFESGESIDAGFFRRRLARAVESRRSLGLLDARGACRLVFSESDGLPGLIVDRYGEYLVCQFLSAGAEVLARDDRRDARGAVHAARHLRALGGWGAAQGRLAVAARDAGGRRAAAGGGSDLRRNAARRRRRERTKDGRVPGSAAQPGARRRARPRRRGARRVFLHGRIFDRVPARRRQERHADRFVGRGARTRGA